METAPLCPICKRPIAEAPTRFRPFCSRRCADIDLGRWLKGSYAIPAEEPEREAETDDGEGGPAGEGRAGPIRRP